MSLETNIDIQENEHIDSSFGGESNPPHPFNTPDSAYNSMVCSPFIPISLTKPPKVATPIEHDSNNTTHESISPFFEVSENEEVFKVSLEQIYNCKTCPTSSLHTSSDFISNSTFVPISAASITFRPRFEESDHGVEIPRYNNINILTSQRSISTQTKFSMGPVSAYRPNSAPLQEGVEEELDEINMEAMPNIYHRIHRNSTCHCILSPMPDLIQPTFQRNNVFLARRLSVIADEIDERIRPKIEDLRQRPRRLRRFSTSSIADAAPGGSFFDLIFSIYNALDYTPTRRRCPRHTTSSLSENV